MNFLTEEALTKVSESIKKSNKKEILNDYRIACESRHASLFGRKEVFAGKAKFGIFGDGKEIAQLALAKVFRAGDFRSGYYRDQTFMLAVGELTLQQYFAQLYAHTDIENEPASGGRLMNGHFATRSLNEDGSWKDLTAEKNSSGDVSPTAAQMPRLVGLAYASKLYRNNPALKQVKGFSDGGNEIAFGTIGNASCAEGMFFEAINAAGVLQIPMHVSVWDDGYGISVPNEYQVTKSNISEVLSGFQRKGKSSGYEIFTVKGWDYEELIKTYEESARVCREEHVPVIVHVTEMTQPQGHSTSGSHERYKSEERLQWEDDFDCIKKLREYILENNIAQAEELDKIETEAEKAAKDARVAAWKAFNQSMKPDINRGLELLKELSAARKEKEALSEIYNNLKTTLNPIRRDVISAVRKALRAVAGEESPEISKLKQWLTQTLEANKLRYNSHLYSQSMDSALRVKEVKPVYDENAKLVDGREILQAFFDKVLTDDPRIFAFGEDVGKIGDVNQAFAGLQEKHGELRVTDTGIRECTIIGQGIGTALRGLKPIAEIQYLDYLLYALQILSDDLATLHYRTKGGQKAPLIIRTRGHRLEGLWHSGSPIGMILNSLRGIRVLVPRNMTQAAGMYNTMLQSDEPALLIECLNGYRLKEKLPTNIGKFTVPLGMPEILREGNDITIVTYGSMCRVIMTAAEQLNDYGISCEIIDVQTLLPFDLNNLILESIKKTGRVLFADEDVPGGGSAYMMQQVVEKGDAYHVLDAKPATLTARDHRPAYADDGDYFSKPNTEDVFDKIYEIMHEFDPKQFPEIY